MVLLVGLPEVVIAIVTGVVTALIIGGAGFLWKMNASIAVVIQKLSHIDFRFDAIGKLWDAKVQEIEKDVHQLEAEVNKLWEALRKNNCG